MGIGKEISRKKIDVAAREDTDPRARASAEVGGGPEGKAIKAALKPSVAEGGPSAVPMGEPPGLVPGGRGERGGLYRLALRDTPSPPILRDNA